MQDWDDVADLCDQAEDTVGYSVVGEVALNSRVAKDKAVEWMQRLAMKAHCNARRLEAKEKRRT